MNSTIEDLEKRALPLDAENLLTPILVGQLTSQINVDESRYKFFIPSYQRGYRWGEEEVTALLEDLYEFLTTSENKKDTYCLQPIVVKQLNDGRYEVLDGQQRLTTIFILLSYLKLEDSEITLFDLTYETRPDSASYLKNLNSDINHENPDYYYISQAFNIIQKWFSQPRGVIRIRRKMSDILLDQVEVIWYEIKEENINPIDIFTRINIGKIPLTNAELVKAVFLSKNNLQIGLREDDKEVEEIILANKQAVIAMEWDAMEKQLQDKQFWAFINSKDNDEYETRIDYILDLVTHNKQAVKNGHHSFNVFYNNLKEIIADEEAKKALEDLNTTYINQEWDKLKSYFDVLLEWYHDKWYNHLIGFLISRKYDLITLLDKYKNDNRRNFKRFVVDEILKLCPSETLSLLKYGKHNGQIESVLLIHNIISALKQPDSATQFPFDKIKESNWSLEHIYAQNSEDLKESDFQNWIVEHLKYFDKYYPQEKREAELATIVKGLNQLKDVENFRDNRDEFFVLFELVGKFINDKINSIENEPTHDGVSDEMANDYEWLNVSALPSTS